MSSNATTPRSRWGHWINEFEETAIAVLLGLMTLITFANVVLRYGFNTGLIWGLEATTFLFAWLVLFGVSYAVKVTAHLGVDALINIFAPKTRRILTLIAAAVCIVYAGLLMKGAWDYWANFANLPQTTGRWFPTGFEEMKRTSYRGWYEVIDIAFPDWLRWIQPIMMAIITKKFQGSFPMRSCRSGWRCSCSALSKSSCAWCAATRPA